MSLDELEDPPCCCRFCRPGLPDEERARLQLADSHVERPDYLIQVYVLLECGHWYIQGGMASAVRGPLERRETQRCPRDPSFHSGRYRIEHFVLIPDGRDY